MERNIDLPPRRFGWPVWWYLFAAMPLAGTYGFSWSHLESESDKYRLFSDGLRNIFVLEAVHFAETLGLLAAVSLGLFVASAFVPKLHDPRLLKAFGLAALFVYGIWGWFVSIWVVMKK